MKIMDFRSDTVTVPSDKMRAAMAAAEVGDDVYRDDPTVIKLEELAAEAVGTEAALFASSGTMGNLVALLTHCGRGESVLLGLESHIYHYEMGGIASLCGVMPYGVDDSCGVPMPDDMEAAGKWDYNVHFAPTTLVCLENTHNRCGGLAVAPKVFAASAEYAHKRGLKVHLDGARIFDAAAAWGVDVKEYTRCVDTVQLCLSKGLGAPVGSLLCGSAEFIHIARRWRKCVGGGMRQAGVIAAAGIIALTDGPGRLHEDHENARLLAQLLTERDICVESSPKMTNMVYFKLPGSVKDEAFSDACLGLGLKLGIASAGRIRMVTHLDVSQGDVRAAADIVRKAMGESH